MLEKLGPRIRKIRRGKDITIEALGESVGMSGASISRYEMGINLPKLETLVKIAEALDVSASSLLEEVAENT